LRLAGVTCDPHRLTGGGQPVAEPPVEDQRLRQAGEDGGEPADLSLLPRVGRQCRQEVACVPVQAGDKADRGDEGEREGVAGLGGPRLSHQFGGPLQVCYGPFGRLRRRAQQQPHERCQWLGDEPPGAVQPVSGVVHQRRVAHEPCDVHRVDQHPRGPRRVQAGDLHGPVDLKLVGGAELALAEVGPGPHACQPRPGERVSGLVRRPGAQRTCPVEVPDLRCRLSGQRQPVGLRHRVHGELHRPFICGSGSGEPATRRGLSRGPLQLGGYALVGAGRSGREVPCPPVGVRRIPQRTSQRPVCGHALAQRCTLVHSRAHQRMTELHRTVSDVNQPGALGRLQVLGGSAERSSRVQHHRKITAALGRRDQQQRLGGHRQPPDLVIERALEPPGQREDWTARPGSRRGRGQASGGQFDQAERVAAGLGEDPGADPGS
jgi:hypothetical protein